MDEEVKQVVEELGQGVESFRTDYEKKLLETQTRLDTLTGALQRRGVALEADGGDSDALAHKQAFERFVRTGNEGGLADLEAKALSAGSDPDGGFAVPETIDAAIESVLVETSPIRSVARVVEIGTSDWKTLVNQRGIVSGWVGESDARAETDTPAFAEVVPPIGEIYANPAVTQTLLDDAFFNVEEFLAANIAEEFVFQEGGAFISGDGVNKPKGFLADPTDAADDSARAFGTLQHVITGVDGGFPASDPSDILFDLIGALRVGYRQGARFVMNSATANVVRKFKDADGNYLWVQGLQEGQPDRLLGYPVTIAEDMPDIALDSLSVAFGNFRRGYVVLDRTGTRVLRDPFSNKPFVHFYTTKRIGGGVVNSEAIKLLKFSAT